MNRPKKGRLGKGLGALIEDYLGDDAESASGDIRTLQLRSIAPNPLQPRREFTPAELEDLAASIRENGLLQPLVVRPDPEVDGRFQLVAGERRFRAISELGWDEVPVLVRAVEDDTLLVLALVENLQREALNPLEEAEGYQTLADRFGMTQAQIARAVGKDRSTVANMLRLLQLPLSIRKMVEAGELSMGHARAILSIEHSGRAAELARQAAKEGWSVREVERRVRGKKKESGSKKKSSAAPEGRNPVVRALEEELRAALGTRAIIRRQKSGEGTIEVPFHNDEDFERIFALLAGREASEVIG